MDWFKTFEDPKRKEMKKEVNGVFNTIEYTIHSIVNKIENIDQLSDQEIKDIIVRQHNLILDYDLFLRNDTTRKAAQKLFINKRFLLIFLDVSGILQLTQSEIICINKIIYDFHYHNNVVDNEISCIMMQLSYNINNRLIIRLYSKLEVKSARLLAVIANSSFKDNIRVYRINQFIIRYNSELSLQDIVDIYCILFERITPLIMYSMLETKQSGMNPKELQRFDMISQAIIVLLHNLTSEDMRKVLYNYAYLLKLNNITAVRFKLKSVKDNRLQKIISEVEYGDMEILKIP